MFLINLADIKREFDKGLSTKLKRAYNCSNAHTTVQTLDHNIISIPISVTFHKINSVMMMSIFQSVYGTRRDLSSCNTTDSTPTSNVVVTKREPNSLPPSHHQVNTFNLIPDPFNRLLK